MTDSNRDPADLPGEDQAAPAGEGDPSKSGEPMTDSDDGGLEGGDPGVEE